MLTGTSPASFRVLEPITLNIFKHVCTARTHWNFIKTLKGPTVENSSQQLDTSEFFGGGGGDESPRWGHSPRMRSGGSRDEGSLPNFSGWEFILFIKTRFYGGALTSHFIEEHSSPTSIFPVFMMTSSKGNMFRVTGFCVGNSPVTDEFPSHRPVTRTFDVFFDLRLNKGWVNNQDAGDLRRHRSHYDVTVIQRVTLVQFWIGEWWNGSNWGVGGVSMHYGRNGLKFGTLLYPDYLSLKLTIFCT